MANLRIRSSKPSNEGCRRHPKHRQSPGVCSLCLREKLSKLSANYSNSRRCPTTAKLASFSSSSTSSYCSSSSSPINRYRFSTTEGKDNSFNLLLFSGKKNILSKSRSVLAPFGSRMRSKELGDHKKKSSGFMSWLLHPRSNKRKEEVNGLDHSRTMK